MKTQAYVGALALAVSVGLTIAVGVSQMLHRSRDAEFASALAELRRQVDVQAGRIETLEQPEVKRGDLGTTGNQPKPSFSVREGQLPDGPVADATSLSGSDDVAIATSRSKRDFNKRIVRSTPEALRRLLGEPRENYTDNCNPVTNPHLLRLLETRQVGDLRLTMLRPALDSLVSVLDRLRTERPDLYDALGTAGALCARYVRGSQNTVSSHAWGIAIDLTLSGVLDTMGDNSSQLGLIILAEFFNAAGWYWGGGDDQESSMHFEVGEGLLHQWHADGRYVP